MDLFRIAAVVFVISMVGLTLIMKYQEHPKHELSPLRRFIQWWENRKLSVPSFDEFEERQWAALGESEDGFQSDSTD